KRGKVRDPDGEIVHVPSNRIASQPTRTGLPAPVSCRHLPALLTPVFERLEVLFVEVATAGHEQQRSAPRVFLRISPIEAPNRSSVWRDPVALARGLGDGLAIKQRDPSLGRVPNNSLLSVVTI